MKIKSIFLTVFSIISILLLQSCDTKEINPLNDPNNISEDGPTDLTKSRIQFKLVDAPDDTYLEVWVEIVDVQYNRNDDDSGWTSFDGYPKSPGDKVDLLSLTAGSSHILTDQDIESGMLSKVRLILGNDNWIKVEEQPDPIDLKTPSAQQSGLKLHLNTELVAGYSYTFVLDWNVQKSIVKAGNSGNYNLKPVIRVIAEANSGTILGRIADILEEEDGAEPMPIDGATIYVFPNDSYLLEEEITSTVSSNEEDSEGLFMVQGLAGGDTGTNYYLRIDHPDYDMLDFGPVMVLNGQDINVNTLHLTKSTGSIIGRVADILENETDALPMPIGDATVNIYYKGDDDFSDILATTTTSNEDDETKGTFNFSELLPGEYVLKVMMTSYDEGLTETIEVVINTETNAGTILLTAVTP